MTAVVAILVGGHEASSTAHRGIALLAGADDLVTLNLKEEKREKEREGQERR